MFLSPLIDTCLLCQRLLFHARLLCRACEAELTQSPLHWREEKELSIFSLFDYVNPVDKWAKKWKSPLAYEELAYFSQRLADKFSYECLTSVAGVIPMPAKTVGQRDHAYVVAEKVAEFFRVPLATQFLTRLSDQTAQKEKSRSHRQRLRLGLRESFTSHVPQNGSLWILVDDVVTTGSTLVNAWSLLGGPPAVGLTVASTPRWTDLGLPAAKPSGEWGRVLWQ